MLGIGSGRVSELLTFRRPLALDMIRTLAVELSLSEVCLVQRYDLVPAAPKRGRPRVQAGRIGKKAVLIHKKAFGIRLLGLLRRWGRILNPRDHSTGSAAARPWA
jgi:hypothetical protein